MENAVFILKKNPDLKFYHEYAEFGERVQKNCSKF